MKDSAPQKIFLSDYTPFGYILTKTALTFALNETATRVHARLHFAPNPEAKDKRFFLHGEELTLIWATIDGAPAKLRHVAGGIEADVPDGAFVWEAEVEINPTANTALEGLYISKGMYCTQCEAEGFRKITYFPDRPDVLSTFHVRIESDLPVRLSNGNEIERGTGYTVWHDPWPKPSYLFALVAGDLVAHPDRFTTASGRAVDLNIWVRPGDEDKCAFGMDALKRAMAWDEACYGREYDLDLFNIVAVDDFNMGAMENKGLNIFNASCVLASPETSTDANFERIEAIIAHEYFHNWTGNRITCRDWFQLCLKEGLTVFRDQQFSADMRSAGVRRIEDVIALRGRQFREDAGPLAHPVRPDSFVEINNFYTATVYEKGAELIGMLKTLVGDVAYRKALDLYFLRHDGQAVTIEDWLKVFEDATGTDLSQFMHWYSDAGTPRLSVKDAYENGRYTLTLSQETAPTPGQTVKPPRVIPLRVGFLNDAGAEMHPEALLVLREARQSFTFDLPAKPVLSLLRGFSAPVVLDRQTSLQERAFLLRHDSDAFARWEAGYQLATDVLIAAVGQEQPDFSAYCDALLPVIRDGALEPAYHALLLRQPTEDELAQSIHERGGQPDPLAIHRAAEALKEALAQGLADEMSSLMSGLAINAPYAPDADQAGRRALHGALLALRSRLDGGAAASDVFENASNMTDQLTAFAALLRHRPDGNAAAEFYHQWRHDRLVIDKWFALQIGCAAPEHAVAVTQALTEHPDFDLRNPNRFRATLGALAGNTAGFHALDGSGYQTMADWLIRLDPINPQTAARMISVFESWKRYAPAYQEKMRAALERIAQTEGLSRDTREKVGLILQ